MNHVSDSDFYIGLISGTSADGIDCALVDFSPAPLNLIHTLSFPLPTPLREEILALMVPTENEIDRLGVADQLLGEVLAQAVQTLLDESNISANQIKAIGSHGQTLRHRPPGELERAFTLQIGDPNIIAEQTGITTIADFRRRDMAAGGHGAPLAPLIHHHCFRSDKNERIIVNIGGISNITYLKQNGDVIGFDTGPGNCLMDGWIMRHKSKPYDANGEWAASGTVHSDLLQALLMHSYFSAPTPKSTGREMFTLQWLNEVLDSFDIQNDADIQATLLHLTATTIANQILDLSLSDNCDIYVCGGGAHNPVLMDKLGLLLQPHSVSSTDALNLSPDWVEACAFALMAKFAVERKASNIPSVTGAKHRVSMGGIYPK